MGHISSILAGAKIGVQNGREFWAERSTAITNKRVWGVQCRAMAG